MGMPETQAHAFGKYVLLQRIAAGGMAEIFKARYAVAGGQKTCVVKRILPHLALNDDFVTMFHDEAKISVNLSHANIVQVFDFGKIQDDHFLAMEYVQGQNLSQTIKKLAKLGQTLPVPIALYIAAEVAKGLYYAHSRTDESGQPMGIVHRDVSPANILVSYEGAVKIADFGIAKAASKDAATKTGHIKGKASYLAPEQLLSRDLDGRADVFALGAVLWEMLAGRKLFKGENELEIIAKVSRVKIQPPSTINSHLPKELDGVVMKALQRNLRNRYQTADELYRALNAVIRHFGITVSSTEVGAYLKNLFKDELEAELQQERELSKSFPDLDLESVRQGAEQESTQADLNTSAPGRSSQISGSVARPPRPRKGRVAIPVVGALFVVLAAGVWVAPEVGVNPPITLPVPPPSALFGRAPDAEPTPMATPTAVAGATEVETPVPTPARRAHRTTTHHRTHRTPQPTPTKVAAKSTPKVDKATPAAEEATPAPTPAAVAGYGKLSLESHPWGEIYVNGKKIGRQTPAFGMKLPAGKHQIRLVNPVLKAEASFVVNVEKDKTVVRRVALKKSDVVSP